MTPQDAWARFDALVEVDEARLSPREQTFLAVGRLIVEVNNGGFDQYFSNSAGGGAEAALLGLRTAAAVRAAQALEQALSILSVEGVADRHLRQEALSHLEPEAFGECDGTFCTLMGEDDPQLALVALLAALPPPAPQAQGRRLRWRRRPS